MDREIKYRAWDGKRMIYFSELTIGLKKGKRIVPYVYFKKDNFAGELSLASHKIMQYTGLKDKNVKEIYEGDVFKYYAHKGLTISDITGEIFYNNDDACFAYYPKGYDVSINLSEFDELQNDFLNHIEVIGNIYESPELLNNKNV